MYSPEEKLYLAILSTAFLIAIIIVYYVYSIIKTHRQEILNRNQYLLREMNLLEAERERIAHNLHDSAGPELALIKMKLDSLPQVSSEQNEIVGEIKREVDRTLSSLRYISHNLMPVTLKSQGIIAALEELSLRQSNSSLKIQFESSVTSEINSESSIHLFRMTEEIIYNAIKHSKASIIKIRVTEDAQNLHLVIKDNGIGIDTKNANQTSNGLGFKGFEYRTNLIGGTFKMYTDKNKGVEIEIITPIHSIIHKES